MATRAEWSKRIERWEKSGLSARAFAAREGVDAKRLTWWRWKLRSSPLEPPEPAAEASLSWLPVRVVDPPPPPARALPRAALAPSAPAQPSPLEIALPNGRVVRVWPDVEPEALARVLAVAAQEPTRC